MIPVSDTICDVLPYCLKAEVKHAEPEPWRMDFGRYDLFPTDSTWLFFDFEEATTLSVQPLPTGSIGEPIPFSPWIHSVFFLLFLFSFMLSASVFRWERTALTGNIKSVFTLGKQVSPTHKSPVEARGEFYFLLQSVLVFSILLFSRLWSNGLSMCSVDVQALGFVGIFAAIALWICLKIMGYRLIGTFFLQHEMNGWIIRYSRIMEVLGILFFLPTVFYVYLHEIRNIVLIGLVILFFISRLVIYISLLDIFVKNKIGLFYFFVYLCGTEIAPCLLLYKGALFVIITIAGDNII